MFAHGCDARGIVGACLILSFRLRRGLSQSLGPLSGWFCRRVLKLNEVKHLDVFDFEGHEVVGVSWFL